MMTASYQTPKGVSGEVRGEALEMAAFFSALGTTPSASDARRGRPPKAAGRKRGGPSKYDDSGKKQIVTAANDVGRGGMPAFLKEKGISYGSLVNWRKKFGTSTAKPRRTKKEKKAAGKTGDKAAS